MLDMINKKLEEQHEEMNKEKRELRKQIVSQQEILNARETELNNLQPSYNQIENSLEDKDMQISCLENQ